MVELNWLMIAVSAAVYFVWGFVWYEVLFGKVWLELAGITKEQADKAMEGRKGKVFVWSYILAFISCITVAHMLALDPVKTLGSAFNISMCLWVGLVLAVGGYSVLYDGKPIKLMLLNAGYHLAGIASATVILTLFG